MDAAAAATRAGTQLQRRAGHRAQARSVTVLTNGSDGNPVLPLEEGCRVHLVDMDADALSDVATVVDDQRSADVTILRIGAAFEPRTGGFASMFHAGSLEYSTDELDRLCGILATGPTVLVVHIDRPAILTPRVDRAAAIVAEYGCSDSALVDALFGRIPPAGRLPVELPRSMAAVLASDTDAPHSTDDPLFPLGHGLMTTEADAEVGARSALRP